jgi:hypothetical protein
MQQLPAVVRFALRWLPWIILATGLVVVCVSCHRILDRSRLEAEGVAASGVVKWASTIGSGTSKRISVVYQDRAGHEWTRYFTVFSSQYRAGQVVDVVYLPTSPEIAVLRRNEAGETHTHDKLAAVSGAVAVLAGVVMIWLRRRA